jgi:predicted Zn finger-like uncharacterized protein
MIIVCQKCSTRLQIDDDKSPTGAFTVRCPKCKNTINSVALSPASEQSAVSVGGSPSTEHPRYDQVMAPAYRISNQFDQPETPVNQDVMRALMNLLSNGATVAENPGGRSWNRRKALICASEPFREPVARGLTESGYQVFVAEDTRQAVETMRANQMEVVLLDPQFDAVDQGAAFVVREINVLRLPQRRRLFFVLISPTLRTMDAHAAFLNNVNAVVNNNDIAELPKILDVALREFNELYRELNQAFNLAAL